MPSLTSQQTPTHGGISENLILPDENRSEFDSLLDGLLADYQPATTQHRIFVEQLAIGHWLLWRRQRASNAVETRVYENFSDPANWIDPEYRRLFLIERYKTAAECSLKRALQNAESIRKGRQTERGHLDRHAKWRAEQDLREARHKFQQEKQAAAAAKTVARRAAKSEPGSTPPEAPAWPTGKAVPTPAVLKE